MRQIKTLIVDDSLVFRSQIRSALSRMECVELVAAASNGKIALERLQQSPVDLIILDLEMPLMNGLELLRELKANKLEPKVIVFSSASVHGANRTMDALSSGACDFVTKPDATSPTEGDPAAKIHAILEPRILALFPDVSNTGAPLIPINRAASQKSSVNWNLLRPKVIVIGSSTGGPGALEHIFAKLQRSFSCPILITQHMPPVFTTTLAERLEKLSGIPCAEGKNGEQLESGKAYVAPGGFHMSLCEVSGQVEIKIDKGPLIHSVRPAVNPLFITASDIYGKACLGLVLTGMGEDGKTGALAIRSKGGAVMIQDKASCVVFGMPGAVFDCGAYDRMGNLDEIVDSLRNLAA